MSANHASERSAFAEIERCYNIQFDRRSSFSSDRVWQAITNPLDLSVWMAYPAEVDLRVGGKYFVDFGADSGENLDGVIVALEPGKLLRYVWGLSTLEWRIESESTATNGRGSGCRYTFLHHGMPVRGIADEEGVAAGWHSWLDALEARWSGMTRSKETEAAFCREISPHYRMAIGAEIGPLNR